MSDLIRREDVLNLVSKGISTDTCEDMKYVIELIKAIPTAEPNWIPLHFDEYKMASDYPNEMDGKWVIVTDGKNISVERIKKDAYDHFYPKGRWFEMENVIAWMPLPKHYEMERRMI